jgi:hypothetical protein
MHNIITVAKGGGALIWLIFGEWLYLVQADDVRALEDRRTCHMLRLRYGCHFDAHSEPMLCENRL